jgi:NAD(P)-dependent dehydrogenase (short-subunit alcohol dehydrogenase family)
MNVSAQGMRVLVTAGAAGIGRAIAQTFAGHGARVHICDVDAAALAAAKETLPAVTQTVADVASVADVDRLFADVGRALGGLDVLVNNAGIAGPTGKVEDLAPADWDRCIAVDLNGMFYCTRRAMPLIKQAGGGSIINLSSVAGRLGFPMRTPYAAAKWAVKARALGITADAMRDRLLDTVSLRTFVSPQDIANLALFLATDAGKHITGQALSVCGDVQRTV